MGNLFTADQHFGHESIIKYCNRPFQNAAQMGVELVRRYKTVVDSSDTVFFLGDLMIGKQRRGVVSSIIRSLPGRKILILGNHDELSPWEYLSMGFESVHTSLDIGDFVLVHDPALSCVDRDRQFLCGHIHDIQKKMRNALNVGVDVWAYAPATQKEVVAALAS